ncbi:nicotinamide riboside transporter PnuC [Actinocorallia sp. API 0066]|uniref:nicotinamide riboside transporter PnuC n=1 Tax=Actinocorallia sp. API 0066 TaxID=2896846 RepID=UPI001E4A72E5|nr:nicotinamide riboside transporter PnuC [Actinocorallia sp. API 0066]MCD0451890.1 nicotinamide riboside transporter PnuC [Actinocorallia sp. API 0066]
MLHELVRPLLEPAFTVGGTPTSWGEVLGFGTGVLTVWLVVRQHIANWGVGIVNVVILGLIFLDSGLYADASLQIVYVVLGLYGWWTWLYGGEGRTVRLVQRTAAAEWAGIAVGVVAATALMTWVLVEFTESTVPFWDALTTALSLAATYGQCRKLVESWILWITVDLIYVPLYAYKGLYLTGALYVIFLALCVAGLRAWRRDLTVRAAALPAAA